MISIEQLTERKQTVQEDIKNVEEALQNLETQRSQLQANLYALQGAVQQIDYFLESVEEKEDE
jgi:uncharacterized protein (DUF3084 family)